LRAALTAVSTASAPVFIGSALAMPVVSQTARRNGPRRSVWKARLVTASRSACSVRTRTSAGWPWPKLTAEYADIMSRWRRPASSNSQTPAPRSSVTGNG